MSTRQEQAMEIVCNLIDSVIDGQARVIGGMLVGDVIVVTLNNGYYANVNECLELSRLIEWHKVMACPGAITIDTTATTGGVLVVTPHVSPPFINPRLGPPMPR